MPLQVRIMSCSLRPALAAGLPGEMAGKWGVCPTMMAPNSTGSFILALMFSSIIK